MEQLTLGMLKDRENTLGCDSCVDCEGLRCSTGFFSAMAQITEKAKEDDSMYIISNGMQIVERLVYKEYPKQLVKNMTILFLNECKSFHEVNSAYLGLAACLKYITGSVGGCNFLVAQDVINKIAKFDKKLALDIEKGYYDYKDIKASVNLVATAVG